MYNKLPFKVKVFHSLNNYKIDYQKVIFLVLIPFFHQLLQLHFKIYLIFLQFCGFGAGDLGQVLLKKPNNVFIYTIKCKHGHEHKTSDKPQNSGRSRRFLFWVLRNARIFII